MIEDGLYLEVDLFAIFLLGVMIFGQRRFSARMEAQRLFHRMVFALTALLSVDMAAHAVDGAQFFGARFWNNLSESVYYMLVAALCLYWFRYAVSLTRGDDGRASLAWYSYLPAALMAAAAIASPWTHWVFYVDARNLYHRGWAFAIEMLVGWCYLCCSSLLLWRCARREHLLARRRDFYMLASFAVYPLLGSLIQMLFYGLTVTWPASACALMVIFLDQMNRSIATDALTGLNNRGRLDRFLEVELADTVRDSRLFMVLIDVDHFKRINDTFGHTAGDLALIRVAGVLKKAVAQGYAGDFLARYGGDEFAILCRRRYGEETEEIELAVERALAEDNARRAPGEPELALSMGYADARKGDLTSDLIRRADAQMYQTKRLRHAREDAAQDTKAGPQDAAR